MILGLNVNLIYSFNESLKINGVATIWKASHWVNISILELNRTWCNHRLRQVLEVFPFPWNHVIFLTLAQVLSKSTWSTDAINMIENIDNTKGRSTPLNWLNFCHFHICYVKFEASPNWYIAGSLKPSDKIYIFLVDLYNFWPDLLNCVRKIDFLKLYLLPTFETHIHPV